MRKVAEHNKREIIARFLEYLHARGIAAEIRALDAGCWGLWVYHEDSCRDVRREFDAYMENPSAARYDVAVPADRETVAGEERREERDAKAGEVARKCPFRTARGRAFSCGPVPVTLVLLALSILASLPIVLHTPAGARLIGALRADPRIVTQWWRILTPAFLHFNWLHIIFNMLWLRELGGRVEHVKGSGYMLLFFAVSAGVSNYAQYIAGSGQTFGGMSGVVYGLFGYIWIKARMFPEEGFVIDPGTVMMLMLWFFLGWTGAVGPIANWAHGFGLGSGILLALAPRSRLS